MYVHILQHQQESKNAKELSEQFVEVIRAAKKSKKDLSYKDVCQATRLTSIQVREELGGVSLRTQNWIVVGILVGIMVAGIAVLMLTRSPPLRPRARRAQLGL